MLFCNCIPHLSCGVSGTAFPTPFAKPRGVGNSPPWANFIWGASNLFAATLISIRRFPSVQIMPDLVALATGFLLAGIYLSLHFGRVRKQ